MTTLSLSYFYYYYYYYYSYSGQASFLYLNYMCHKFNSMHELTPLNYKI